MLGKQVESEGDDCDCPVSQPEKLSASDKSKKKKTKKKKTLNPEEKSSTTEPSKIVVDWVSEMKKVSQTAPVALPEHPKVVVNNIDTLPKSSAVKRDAILKKWFRLSQTCLKLAKLQELKQNLQKEIQNLEVAREKAQLQLELCEREMRLMSVPKQKLNQSALVSNYIEFEVVKKAKK